MTDNQMFILALICLCCGLSLMLWRPKVEYSTTDFRLCADMDTRNLFGRRRVQKRQGNRWVCVARVDDFDEGYWLVNRLQWPRKF